MTAVPKKKRIINEAYLDFIREKPCCVCGNSPVDADHLKTRGSGGSDYTAIPLCRLCHVLRHQKGGDWFGVNRHLNLWREAHQCLEEWITK